MSLDLANAGRDYRLKTMYGPQPMLCENGTGEIVVMSSANGPDGCRACCGPILVSGVEGDSRWQMIQPVKPDDQTSAMPEQPLKFANPIPGSIRSFVGARRSRCSTPRYRR